jgi:hypothetical protein
VTRARRIIEAEIFSFQDLVTVKKLKAKLLHDHDINLTSYMIKQILKKDLMSSYKNVKNAELYVNSSKNIRLRAQFFQKMIDVIEKEKIFINFDESIIQEQTNQSRSWHPRGC